jgi:hypothetical protein
MTVPFAFANLSGNIALSKLDSNFNTPITIGNTSVQLGNTITTINNVTLANVTITSGTSNVTNVNVTSMNVTNLTATLANITTLNAASAFITTGNIATANVGNLTLLNALTVPNGGTGRVTLPANNVLLGNGTGSLTSVAPGNSGNVLTSIGGVWVSNAAVASGGGTGTVTNVSVVSANGFSGTVANSTSNASITLSATFMGIAWSNSTGVLSNVAIGTGLSFSNTTGVLIATGAVANAVTSVGNTYPILSTGGTTPTISFVDPGTAGNVLTSIGGVWKSNAAVGGSGSPGGNPGQIQFNNSGAFGGDGNLTFSGSTTTAANLIVSNLTASLAIFSSATKQLVSNPITGTGSVVMNSSPIVTSPSLITPALGSPTSGNMAATTNIPVANATGTLAVANGGTGVTSSTGTGSVVLNTSPTLTTPTLINPVLGTPTSGSLVATTNIPVANATGVLAVGNGGTGLTTIPAGNVVIGNGTSALYGLAPGTAGNVLTSIGGSWVSNAAVTGSGSPGGSTTQFQYNNGGVFAGAANLTTDGANTTIGSANTFRFANLTSTRYVGFKANAIVAANVTWTLPVADGTSGQVLSTDGSGILSWVTSGSTPTAPSTVEYLVVAAGGGGGYYGGGGGAGGLRSASGYAVTPGSAITVTINAGGAGGNSTTGIGSNGGTSVFGSITSTGGGGGGTYEPPAARAAGQPGASGGGGGRVAVAAGGTATSTPSGQGNDGGTAEVVSVYGIGGGGGGAGAVGGSYVSGNNPPAGGAGSSAYSVWGAATGTGENVSGTYYYAGGGGAGNGSGNGGLGGSGGGGRGNNSGTAGTANTGGGGGGSNNSTAPSGGSGIVIVRYADSYTAAASTTGSPAVVVTGGYRYYTFTGSGSITF